MLVEVVDELGDPAVQAARDGDVVEDRQVLDELAQADAAGVRADRDAELRGHQHTARISLTLPSRQESSWQKSIASGLEHLLEQHPVHAVLAGRHPDRGDGPADRGVTEHVVGAGRLLDPQRRGTRRARSTQSMASGTSQTWLASIIRLASGPMTSRAMAQRRMSSSQVRARP